MIITLCGSIRFLPLFDAWNEALSCAGHAVFGLGVRSRPEARPTPEDKAVLDDVHKRKIDASDAVLVLNRFAYIGESTMSEIEYALSRDKEIRFLESWGEGLGIGDNHTDEVRALAAAYGVPDGYVSPLRTCDWNCWPSDWLGPAGAKRTALVETLHTANYAAPASPAIQLCVTGLVADPGGRILLVHHVSRGWELPGGKVEPGEPWREALAREVREETGLDVALAEEHPRLLVGEPVPGAPFASWIALARGTAVGLPRPGDPDGLIDDARWFTRDEVPLDRLSQLTSADVVRAWVWHGGSEDEREDIDRLVTNAVEPYLDRLSIPQARAMRAALVEVVTAREAKPLPEERTREARANDLRELLSWLRSCPDEVEASIVQPYSRERLARPLGDACEFLALAIESRMSSHIHGDAAPDSPRAPADPLPNPLLVPLTRYADALDQVARQEGCGENTRTHLRAAARLVRGAAGGVATTAPPTGERTAVLEFLRNEEVKFSAYARDDTRDSRARERCANKASMLRTMIAYIERGDHVSPEPAAERKQWTPPTHFQGIIGDDSTRAPSAWEIPEDHPSRTPPAPMLHETPRQTRARRARALVDELRQRFESYAGGDRPPAPPAALQLQLREAEAELRAAEADINANREPCPDSELWPWNHCK